MVLLVLVVSLGAEPKSEAAVSVDSVTVNGATTAAAPPRASKAAVAPTAVSTGQAWSVVTARTVGTGANDLQGALGFPGASFTVFHGMTEVVDLGGRLTLNYGWEGQVGAPLEAGVKVQGVAKVRFFENGKVNAGAQLAPGLMVYSANRHEVSHVGMTLPLSFTLGIAVSSAVGVGVVVDLPMWVRFGPGGGFVFPVLMGAGLEYFVTSALALWFDLRMGPSLWVGSNRATQLTMDGKLGVAWRF